MPSTPISYSMSEEGLFLADPCSPDFFGTYSPAPAYRLSAEIAPLAPAAPTEPDDPPGPAT